MKLSLLESVLKRTEPTDMTIVGARHGPRGDHGFVALAYCLSFLTFSLENLREPESPLNRILTITTSPSENEPPKSERVFVGGFSARSPINYVFFGFPHTKTGYM